MPTPATLPDCLRFGRFELRPHEHRLLCEGQVVALGGRAFDLLLALARAPGRLLSRNELIEQVWPGRVVEENNLSVQVNALRKVLGDEWLQTVPGRGYRFVAPALAPEQDASPAATGAVDGAAVVQAHLPILQPLLIGRSEDLAALGTLIEQHRLVTVVGAGGMGKTRLAQALLHLHARRYPHGVCWVELGAVTAPEALPGTVAAALGLQASRGDALAQLTRAVSGLQLLLALDNAEHLLEAVARLAQTLLDAAPRLRLVVTSQAPLRLAEERVLRLGPLAIPQGTLPAQQAQSFGAVALFCERAAAADHRFALNDAEVPAVIELCRRLDGVALAIELAAARAPSLGIERLLAALGDRLRLLRGNRDRLAPDRQQSLRAALSWSVSLLQADETRLFRRLSVVSGSASLALVQHIGGLPCAASDAAPMDPWDVVDALDQLVQRSLVEVLCDEDGAATRYRLLESPRALALELLATSGEQEAVLDGHAQGVHAGLDALHTAMRAGQIGLQDWRHQRELDLGNLRQALLHARRRGHRAMELALASQLLPGARTDEWPALADRVEQLIADADTAHPPADPTAVYQAWRALSLALANVQPSRSLAAARAALVLARELDAAQADRFALYDTLCVVAHMLVDEKEGALAEPLLREALAIEDPRWPAVRLRAGLRVQASLATARGLAAEGLQLYRRLHAADRAAGEAGHVALLNMANAELLAGDAAAAVASGTRLVVQLQNSRHENLLLHAAMNLAAAHLALGQTQPARQIAQDLWTRAPRPRVPAWCVDWLALLAALEGRHEAAARLLGAANARQAAAADVRQLNEQRAHQRTLQLLQTAFEETALDALTAQGGALSDAEVVQAALASA